MANNRPVDEGSMFSGFFYGVLIGSVVALFRGPRIRVRKPDLEQTRKQLKEVGETIRETAMPPDPVDKSMAEGKAAARRRRAELGLDRN